MSEEMKISQLRASEVVSPANKAQKAQEVSAQTPAASGSTADRVELSDQGVFLSKLNEQVKSADTVRPEKVAEFKAKIIAGNYPPPYLIDGLANLIGVNLTAEADAGTTK